MYQHVIHYQEHTCCKAKTLCPALYSYDDILMCKMQLVTTTSITSLDGGFKYCLFSPRKLGKISNLTNSFQLGRFNHQPVHHQTPMTNLTFLLCSGLFAPLLACGTLLVDGTAASCYALPRPIAVPRSSSTFWLNKKRSPKI